MSLIKDSLQKQIENNNRLQFSDTTGTILSYDKTTETCTIKYLNPNGDGYMYKNGVTMSNISGGVSPSGIFPGQKCSISFINNNIYCPVIRGVIDSYYSERNSKDQGAYIADDDVWKTGTPEHIIAMNLDWIDDNPNLSKYENDGSRYNNIDIDEKSMDLVTSLDKIDADEVGIVNLKNKASVRLKDNGDIDVFTENNIGIRICKSTGNIKLYANDIEFTKIDNETTDKSISTQLKVAQIMKICLAYDIIKEVDEYVDAILEGLAGSTDVNGDFT